MTESRAPTLPPTDEFYVGYLTAPRALARFARRTAEALAALVVAGALALSGAQSAPPASHGPAQSPVDFSVIPYTSPAALCLLARDDRPSRWLLVVGERKFGVRAPSGLDAAAGMWSIARGVVIGRQDGDSPACLEVSATPDAIRPDRPIGAPGAAGAPKRPLGRLTLRGQIIDPKCHFGAMKPGEGKVHRACAVRCISGGIPPVLMVHQREARGGAERRVYYILTGLAGEPLNHAVLDFVAEPVEVSGEGASLVAPDGSPVGDDSLRVLRIDPATIRRL